MSAAERNYRWAWALVDGLVQSGVTHAVISPGSRSTPLTLACARHAGLRCWMVPDERSAAFFALGLSRSRDQLAAVIATSGSAPANWYPAVIEASQDMQSLILLSADRPERLQACGANQTIDQLRLFAHHVRAFYPLAEADDSPEGLVHARTRAAQAVDGCRWPIPGPVHINVPFSEPLVPPASVTEPACRAADVPTATTPLMAPAEAEIASLAERLSGGRGIIVCGRGDFPPDFPDAVTTVAQRLACPVLADPLSGLRFGSHDRTLVLTRYDAFLRGMDPLGRQAVDWVLGFGGVPTSKVLQRYIGGLKPDASTLVAPVGPWPDPGRSFQRVMHSDPALVCLALAQSPLKPAPDNWLETFQRAEGGAGHWLATSRAVPLEAAVMAVLGRLLKAGSTLYCGNSMVVRDADSFLPGGEQDLRVLGSRGASGIDGNVSTALGLAAAGTGTVVGLLGDLALYHDMNGLFAARHVDATLVVFNNGGGSIFGYLPQSELPEFAQYWLTPTGLELGQVAKLHGLRHSLAAEAEGFERALRRALEAPGVDLIEVVVDRVESLARHQAYWDAVGKKRSAGGGQ
ncbi:MAG: 2-succinyl-5-enolpyruvyl-6-hydroxy-3-cyclohexene-1-carboxylic-acid synthase [Gammaproteobacteria bacterium]|nr:2-succinyl-5-enolpyruvyl-6-hydroxy-3-cyclohexene-1-carboxylic-acid synthase [Gammaproteobacteria bacterium]MDJ0891702.1 2-succinyl-5-enolpyruvyl-6-hydroxy-3-cyclohexene-1-carboxylic-acid synthase [Gammaproteobacteria bacterium]